MNTLAGAPSWLLVVLLLIALPNEAQLASGQAAKERARHYVEQGDALLLEGKEREARRAFEDALLAERNNPEALRRLGRLSAEKEDWGDARKRYNALLDVLEDDPEAHYYVGIADRESGRARPPLVGELLEWRRSRAHFEAVLAADSLYEDALYQYALLKAYQGGEGTWKEGLALVDAQVRLKPDLAAGHVGAMQLYRRFIERWHDAGTHEWLVSKTNAPYAALFAAEVTAMGNLLGQAEQEYDTLFDRDDLSPVAVSLGLARLHHRQGKAVETEGDFWEAVRDVRGEADARLVFEDVKYVVSDEELTAFERLTDAESFRSWFRALWTQRNPLPASGSNPRLVEHYRRLIEADQYYVYYGYRGWVNNPDKLGYLTFPAAYRLNERYNDKGLVYIRHGEPDDRVLTMAADAPPNESWKYFGSPDRPEMDFHFVIDDNTAGGNNWRLTAILESPQMLLDRAEWGRGYYQMYRARTDERRAMDLGMLQIEMGDRSREMVLQGLTSDRHHWVDLPRPLPFAHAMYTSRGASSRTHVEIYYVVPLRELDAGEVEGKEVLLQTGVAFHTPSWEPFLVRTQNDAFVPSAPGSGLVIGSYSFEAPPDTYHVAVHAALEEENRLIGYKYDVSIQDYQKLEPSLSDLIPAFEIRPTRADDDRFVRGDLRVVPNPSGSFLTNQPVFLYFEAYHLGLGADDRTKFRVRYTLEPAEGQRKGLRGLFRGKSRPVLSIEFEREGDSVSSIEHGQLDVSAVDPGAYQLTVTVRDQIGGRELAKSVNLNLQAPRSE